MSTSDLLRLQLLHWHHWIRTGADTHSTDTDTNTNAAGADTAHQATHTNTHGWANSNTRIGVRWWREIGGQIRQQICDGRKE